MRRYYKRIQGQLKEADDSNQADQVLIDKEELDTIERKLHNKTEELTRWINRFTGENLDYKLVTVDYIDGKFIGVSSNLGKESSGVYVTISLPIAYKMTKEIKDEAKRLVENVFNQYITKNKRYKLHFAPKAGWSVHLQLTEEELDSFQLPN